MKVKRRALTMFVFVIASLFYSMVFFWTLTFSSPSQTNPLLFIGPGVVLGVLFAWLFHHHRKEMFPMLPFSLVAFFTSSALLKYSLTRVFLDAGLFLIPTAFFVHAGVGIYAGINVLAWMAALLLTGLFYQHGKTCT